MNGPTAVREYRSRQTLNEPGPALAWSGGKDSAMALYVMGGASLLLSTVTEGYERISMHGVRRSLLWAQAQAVGLPVLEVPIPPQCTNAVYEARIVEAYEQLKARDIRSVAFGDLFLADVRAYRERQMARAGMGVEFPLWGRGKGELAREFVRAGFRAVVVCVELTRLDASWAGREFDEAFIKLLPQGVDPCAARTGSFPPVYLPQAGAHAARTLSAGRRGGARRVCLRRPARRTAGARERLMGRSSFCYQAHAAPRFPWRAATVRTSCSDAESRGPALQLGEFARG